MASTLCGVQVCRVDPSYQLVPEARYRRRDTQRGRSPLPLPDRFDLRRRARGSADHPSCPHLASLRRLWSNHFRTALLGLGISRPRFSRGPHPLRGYLGPSPFPAVGSSSHTHPCVARIRWETAPTEPVSIHSSPEVSAKEARRRSEGSADGEANVRAHRVRHDHPGGAA